MAHILYCSLRGLTSENVSVLKNSVLGLQCQQAKECLPTHFPIIENSPTSFSYDPVSLNSNLEQRQVARSYRTYQNLGQIDHNVHIVFRWRHMQTINIYYSVQFCVLLRSVHYWQYNYDAPGQTRFCFF